MALLVIEQNVWPAARWIHPLYAAKSYPPLAEAKILHSSYCLHSSCYPQVFRTNQSYDRWWEARKIWGGVLNRVRDIVTQLPLPRPIFKNA
eukprot:1158772-Pelagomonas_calceolata.AAC.4